MMTKNGENNICDPERGNLSVLSLIIELFNQIFVHNLNKIIYIKFLVPILEHVLKRRFLKLSIFFIISRDKYVPKDVITKFIQII